MKLFILLGFMVAGLLGPVCGAEETKGFKLPISSLRSPESINVPKKEVYNQNFGEILSKMNCVEGATVSLASQLKAQKCILDVYYKSKLYEDLASKYKATIKNEIIAGVRTAIVTPTSGVAEKNTDRVLIDLHGGTMEWGTVHELVINSVPVAATGKIKVISIDYSKAPHHRFPAASRDVASVYRELLKTYKPENIGIYGCAMPSLVGGALAWFLDAGLPLPGAVGMLCGGAGAFTGDSMHIMGEVDGFDYVSVFQNAFTGYGAYFEKSDMNNPLIMPSKSDGVMRQFPPTLLLGATRDFLLSSVIHTHRQLSRLGVKADLHLWEGMGTGFHQEPLRPETQEAYDIIAQFFDDNLSKSHN